MCQLCRVTKVCKFYLTLLVNKDVVRFDISVDDVLFMEMFESLKHLEQDVFATFFGVFLMHVIDHICQREVHKLLEDPEPLHEVEGLEDLKHMVLDFAHVHECNLIVDQTSDLFIGVVRDVLESENFAI